MQERVDRAERFARLASQSASLPRRRTPAVNVFRGPSLREAHVATLQAQLRLDAREAERVQSIVDKYNAKMAPLGRADVALLGALRTQLALTVPDARRLKSLSGALVKNRQRLQSLRDERLRELQKTLTADQFSRLIVRWSALSRQFRREARRARRER